jgi:acyl-CoA synthetase (NDP forming)
MTTSTRLREALFAPKRIAIVGASDDLSKTASRPLNYLRRGGYAGTIYPVNSKRRTVLGQECWFDLASLPERPDHVFIVTPTEAAIAAVEECGRLGIPAATVLANGFSEAGPAGVLNEQRLLEAARRGGVRVLGPSSLGMVNNAARVVLTANAAFAEQDLPIGRTFAASQSGSLIGALVSRGNARGIGFHGLVSVGSEADLSIGEICALTLDDPEIDNYLLFLEGIRQGEKLATFARAAAERGKPVLAYMLGRSEQARELAVTHTGALAGEADVTDEFLAEHGIARVGNFDALLEAVPLLPLLPIRKRGERAPQVGVVTTTGGGGAMIVDQLAIRGVSTVAPTAETLTKLAAHGIEVEKSHIIDLTLGGTRYDVMKTALDTLSAAPEFDLIVAVVGSSARFQPELAVKPIIDSIGGATPIAAFLVPDAPQALTQLSQAGVPGFRTPEACADAVAAAWGRRMPSVAIARHRPQPASARRTLDELQSYALLDELGVERAPAYIFPQGVDGADIEFPVVAKILCADIAHKSDVGGVELGIADAAGLEAAVERIRCSVVRHMPAADVSRILVQPAIRSVGEALLGYRVDPLVGPIIMVAAGGVRAELYRDRSVRLAPVDLDTARMMIREVKGLVALDGYRNLPRGDLEALAETVVHLSSLATARPDVIELEINPVLIHSPGDGVISVDALAVVADALPSGDER